MGQIPSDMLSVRIFFFMPDLKFLPGFEIPKKRLIRPVVTFGTIDLPGTIRPFGQISGESVIDGILMNVAD